MEFRILGPLAVLAGAAEVELSSPKERELLAVLLLHAGGVVSRERLIEELWGESPPPTASKALNVHVSQLRKTLARNGSDPVTTRAPGYVLEVDPDLLDAFRFERLFAEARERVAAGDVESARALLGEALGLWRGPALDGIELDSSARNEVGRLEELRLAALMDRVDCDLALGRHEQLVGELEGLVAAHPLRERLRSQLMLALHRSGRQADALGCYRDTRETLVGELGIEPSAPLQRLERAILNHDPALELPAGVPTSGGPTQPTRRRKRIAALTIAALVVLAAAAALIVFRLAGDGSTGGPSNSVAVIDPGSGRVVRSVPVGIDPGPIAAGAGAVWVANTTDKTLARIDPATQTVTRTLPLGGTPTGVAARDGAVWVVYGRLGSVARIDPQFSSVGEPLRVASRGYGFATADGAVAAGPSSGWVVFGDSTVAEISGDGTRVLRRGFAGAQPSAIAIGDGTVWVANGGGDSISALDPRSVDQIARINVARRPRGLAVGANAVWASAFDDDAVSRVAGSSSRTIAVGNGPLGVALGAGSLWVANSLDGSVSRIDPEQGRVVATIHVGHHPQGVAVGDGRVWVTVAP